MTLQNGSTIGICGKEYDVLFLPPTPVSQIISIMARATGTVSGA
jgi:hypothetical protein